MLPLIKGRIRATQKLVLARTAFMMMDQIVFALPAMTNAEPVMAQAKQIVNLAMVRNLGV